MATPFTRMFQIFLDKDEDYTSLTMLPKNLQYSKLSSFLFSSRSRFRDVAYENAGATENKMDDTTEFQQEVYNLGWTGTSYTITLSPAPPVGTTSDTIYIELNDNGIQWTDFTFDSNTNQLVINNTPDQANTAYVGAYVNGQFNQTLNIVETDILSDGMQIPYLQGKINREKLQNHAVYGKDYGLSGTQGNHIRAQESRLRQMKVDFDDRVEGKYSYQQDPNNLDELGG